MTMPEISVFLSVARNRGTSILPEGRRRRTLTINPIVSVRPAA
jgi:hypothetical protein